MDNCNVIDLTLDLSVMTNNSDSSFSNVELLRLEVGAVSDHPLLNREGIKSF
jgi:hypothetical protein